MRRFFVTLLALAAAFPSVLHPATIRVPADQPTIAAGLAAATAGDEVVVSCGNYFENGLMMKSGVVLRSETGQPECAVIDGAGVQARIVRFTSTTGARLEGVTIRGGRGGGLITNGSTVTIARCVFLENRTTDTSIYGAGLGIFASDVSISDSRFHENRAYRSSGIYQDGGSLEISGCEFTFNKTPSGYGYAALRLGGGGAVSITSSRFVDNDWVLDVVNRPCSITDCTFAGNGGAYARQVSGTLSFRNSALEISGCLFSSNNATRSAYSAASTYQFFGCPSVLIESCVFHSDTTATTLLEGLGETGSVRRSIFSNIRSSSPLFGCGVSVACSDFWANRFPPFGSSCTADTTGVLFSDPMFCDAANGDFRVAGASPCLPGASPCGELIGVLGAGCGPVSLKAQSWGRVKNLYR